MSVMRKPPRPDYFNFDKALVARLADEFRLGDDIAFRPILLDGAACSLIDVRSATSRKMVLRAGGADLFLKQIPWYCDDAQHIRFTQTFQDAAGAAGLPVPHLLRTQDGHGWLEIADAKYTMTRYVPGHRFAYRKAQAIAAAAELARLHRIGPTVETHRQYAGSAHAGDAFRDAAEHVELAREIARERADDQALAALEGLEQCATTAREAAAGWESLPGGFVHGDFAPWNLVFAEAPDRSPARVGAIVDFDNAHWGVLIRDLAEAVITFGWVAYDGDSSSFAGHLPGAAQPFVAAMRDAYETVRPLGGPEAACLPHAAVAVGVEILGLGYLRGDYDAGVLADGRRWLAAVSASLVPEASQESLTGMHRKAAV